MDLIFRYCDADALTEFEPGRTLICRHLAFYGLMFLGPSRTVQGGPPKGITGHISVYAEGMRSHRIPGRVW